MNERWELHSGGRSIGIKAAPSAQIALLDHVRSMGCKDDEITRLGIDAVAWRGAIFRAVRVSDPEPGIQS